MSATIERNYIMGTRAIVRFYDIEGCIVSIYKQFDGYLSGLGQAIVDCFKDREFVNGIPGDATKYINGMNDAAALLIAYLKNDLKAGNVYVYPPDTENEEYTYEIYGNTILPENGMSIKVFEYDKLIYDGPFEKFEPKKLEVEIE